LAQPPFVAPGVSSTLPDLSAAASTAAATGLGKGGHKASIVEVPASILDALASKEGLFIKQKVDMLESLVDWEVPNR